MVPFSALHDGSRYLVNSYAFRYLSSARDSLQRFPLDRRSQRCCVADPDFRAGWDDLIDNGNDSALPLPRLAKQLQPRYLAYLEPSAQSRCRAPAAEGPRLHGQDARESCFAHCKHPGTATSHRTACS